MTTFTQTTGKCVLIAVNSYWSINQVYVILCQRRQPQQRIYLIRKRNIVNFYAHLLHLLCMVIIDIKMMTALLSCLLFLLIVFQQDDDPKHIAQIVKKFIENQNNFFMEWPIRYLDLDAIENLLSIVKLFMVRNILLFLLETVYAIMADLTTVRHSYRLFSATWKDHVQASLSPLGLSNGL